MAVSGFYGPIGMIGGTGPTGTIGYTGTYNPIRRLSDDKGNSVSYDTSVSFSDHPLTIEGNIRLVALLIIKDILDQQAKSKWQDPATHVWYKTTNFYWGPYSFNFRPKELEVCITVPTPEEQNSIEDLCTEMRKLKDLSAFF